MSIRENLSSPPPFVESIDFWLDDLEPHSTSSLSARVLCTDAFWVIQLRCFVRVNGVRARVLDTRFACHATNSHRVIRERIWREGRWSDLAGEEAPTHLHYELVNDKVAAAKLPIRYPPYSEELILPSGHLPSVPTVVADGWSWLDQLFGLADCTSWLD